MKSDERAIVGQTLQVDVALRKNGSRDLWTNWIWQCSHCNCFRHPDISGRLVAALKVCSQVLTSSPPSFVNKKRTKDNINKLVIFRPALEGVVSETVQTTRTDVDVNTTDNAHNLAGWYLEHRLLLPLTFSEALVPTLERSIKPLLREETEGGALHVATEVVCVHFYRRTCLPRESTVTNGLLADRPGSSFI
ncbi:hypothetical protein Bbelb_026890 [Branchiostoma belcheri]|nr:hypothetical protein Bbelb_026890 [Branchiostoma belcheri]